MQRHFHRAARADFEGLAYAAFNELVHACLGQLDHEVPAGRDQGEFAYMSIRSEIR